jgi:imidazolonepropionase-like amidohydrolase
MDGPAARRGGIFGTAHGISLHGELQLLVRAGLSPVQALRAATSVPARRFGLSDRGRIGPGLPADLVLIDGDPAGDITATLSISKVWRRGTQLDRDAKRAALV